jgi:ABC-2 type transport system permease protein
VVYAASGLIGVNLRLEAGPILGVILVIILGSMVFATFSLIVACIVRSRERLMGIGQILTMPLFFASSAVYPISLMPDWLQVLARVNPLTYMVDSLRQLMVQGAEGAEPIALDIAILAGVVVLLLTIAARIYPRLAQ